MSNINEIIEKYVLLPLCALLYGVINFLIIYGIVTSGGYIWSILFYSVFLLGIWTPVLIILGQAIYYYFRPLPILTTEFWKNWRTLKQRRRNGEILQEILGEKYIAKIIMEYIGDNNSGIEVIIR